MATSDHQSKYFGDGFCAPGFHDVQRHITGYHSDGSSHFLVTDNGSYRAQRVVEANGSEAAETILYSTFEFPVNMNNDDDMYAFEHDMQGHHIANGSLVKVLDFSPGAESAMHRGESLDYNVVLEGEFELILDSGESRILKRGDFSVQRATAHKWRNISGGRQQPGRLFNVLLDCQPLIIDGKAIEGYWQGKTGPYGFGVGRMSLKKDSKQDGA